jgi:hypothetical protein
MSNDMETKSTMSRQKITLADVVGAVEVLNRKQLRQIKGGDGENSGPIKK